MRQVCWGRVLGPLPRVRLLGDVHEEVSDLGELEAGALHREKLAEGSREGRARGERHGLLGRGGRLEPRPEVLECLERGGLLRGAHGGPASKALEEGEARQQGRARREAPAALHVLEEPRRDAGRAAERD